MCVEVKETVVQQLERLARERQEGRDTVVYATGAIPLVKEED